MTTPTQWDAPLARRGAGQVVLSMTPHRARVLATAIWLADRTQWLDMLADDLASAADQRDSCAENDLHLATPQPRPLRVNRTSMSNVGTAGPDDAPWPGSGGQDEPLFEALGRGVEVDVDVARRLEEAASQAALLAFEAVAAAAERAAHAAEAASDVQAVATARAAAAIADTVRETATAVSLRAEEEADRVAGAASDLASRVALSPSAAAGVSAAAVAIAQEVALHATVVARAAATAAMEAAAAAADAAMALELTVRSTAIDVQTVAAGTARRIAGETERAADAARASR
jgi:hypothetical protein